MVVCGPAIGRKWVCQDGRVDMRREAKRFADVWRAGWANGEAESIAALYAEDCVHRSMPFRPPHEGRQGLVDYARWSFESEPAVDVRFGEPMVDGDRAVVEFRAWVVEKESDRPVTLAGCAFVRFGADGLVVEARDYWHTAEGHREPTGRLFF
jgi:ketosteroid isomerase-like protein